MKMIDAFRFMKFAHGLQVTKSGEPYWTHPLEVMMLLPTGSSEDLQYAALLHDVLEDTKYTETDLRTYGFSERTIDLVKGVTRDKSNGMTYMDWIRSIAESKDKELITLKLMDNLHNSDPDRIAALPESERDIIKRYDRARKILQDGLKELEKA